MAEFEVSFRAEGGRLFQKTVDAVSPGEAADLTRHAGFEPLGTSPVTTQAVPPSTTTTPTAREPSLPVLGTPAAVAQLAGGAAPPLAALAFPPLAPAVPYLSPLMALGARVLAGQTLRTPRETAGERTATELLRGLPSELAVPVGSEVLQAGRAIRGRLPALGALRELSPTIGPHEAARVLSPRAEQAVGEATAGTAGTLRRMFGPIFKSEVRGPEGARKAIRTLVRSV